MQSIQALAEAGATVIVGTWPPVLNLFKGAMDAGKLAEDLKTSTGDSWKIEKVRQRLISSGGNIDLDQGLGLCYPIGRGSGPVAWKDLLRVSFSKPGDPNVDHQKESVDNIVY
jgi:hypothetical protein